MREASVGAAPRRAARASARAHSSVLVSSLTAARNSARRERENFGGGAGGSSGGTSTTSVERTAVGRPVAADTIPPGLELRRLGLLHAQSTDQHKKLICRRKGTVEDDLMTLATI